MNIFKTELGIEKKKWYILQNKNKQLKFHCPIIQTFFYTNLFFRFFLQ